MMLDGVDGISIVGEAADSDRVMHPWLSILNQATCGPHSDRKARLRSASSCWRALVERGSPWVVAECQLRVRNPSNR